MVRLSTVTSVFFVSSHKVIYFLDVLADKLGDRKIALCKEITKLNEKVFIGFPSEVLESFKESSKNRLGEFVVEIDGADNSKKHQNQINKDTIGVIKKLLEKFSLTDTVEIVHKIGNIGKKELYKKVLNIKNEE